MQSKPTVFVTQIPNRRDKETGVLVPVINIAPAAEHGEVRVIMPAKANFYASADLVRQLREGLRDYNFERGDTIVPLGDPSIVMTAGAVLAEMRTRFRVLKWDRLVSRYLPVEIGLN